MEKRGISKAESSGINDRWVSVASERKALERPEALTWETVPATERETQGKEEWLEKTKVI